MKKINLVFIFLYISQAIFAQHLKLSATQGLGLDANKQNDSLFFANNYNVSQFRVGYHYGKLGVIGNITYINQQNVDITKGNDKRIPEFIQPINLQLPRRFSNVQTLNTTLGLELCIPIIKRKAQLHFYATYGLSFSNSDSVAFYDLQVPIYSHNINRKTTGCLQTGVCFNYKINAHLGVKWQNEYDRYKLHYTAVDIRKTPSTFIDTQRKNLLVSSIGVVYTF
jgi:hypothetical protein